MGSFQPSHFAQAFGINEAINIMVSTSARSGVPLDLEYVMSALMIAFPDAERAPQVIEEAVIQAAADGLCRLRLGSSSYQRAPLAEAA
jgi:hypothetical protein